MVRAYDFDPEVLAQARRGVYVPSELEGLDRVPAAWAEALLVRQGAVASVRPEVRARVAFARADVFDPRLPLAVAGADVLFLQNVLLNYQADRAARGFRNACRLLRPRGVLFADGLDLGLRARLTRAEGLEPLDTMIREIYEDARGVCQGWPWTYYGLEPFAATGDWRRRYATIFVTRALLAHRATA